MNKPPIVNVQDQIALLNTSINGVSLVSASDPDGDPITKFRFRDKNGTNGSGRIFVNGNGQPANVWIEVTSANLNTLEFVAGNQVIQDTVEVQAFDGKVWSAIAPFVVYSVVPNVTVPVINANTIHVVANEKVKVRNFIFASDPDGWPIDRMQFRDDRVGMNSGYFEFKGVKMPESQWFFVLDMNELDQLYWVGALNGQSEKIFSKARDGAPGVGGQWTDPVTSLATTKENFSPPFVAPFSIVLPHKVTIPMENLVFVSDADGNTIKRYRFLDTSLPTNSAYVSVEGIRRPHHEWIYVDGDKLDTVTYTSAQINRDDLLRVQAFDGRHWSTIQTIRITSEVQPSFDKPKIFAFEDLDRINLIDLIAKSDNGPTFKSYQVYDNSTTHSDPMVDLTGNLVFGINNFQGARQLHQYTRNEFEQLFFEGGKWDNRAIDELYVRAHNGRFNTRWERITVRSEPEMRQSHHAFSQGAPLEWKRFFVGEEKIVLTYSFAENFPQDGRAVGEANPDQFFVFSPVGRQAIREEFSRFSKMFDTIDFLEISDTGPVHPQFGAHGFIRVHGYVNPDSNACAYAFLPANPAGDPSTGDIWLNYGLCFDDNPASWALDGSQRMIFRHELGHALGLKHPYFVDGNPGNQNAAIMPPSLGSHDYSIMYTPGGRPDGLFTRSFGLYADAALLDFYGVGTVNSGNTRYDIENYWQGDGQFVDGITDAGGVDTLAIDNSLFDNILDIREGSFSSINGLQNNLYINFGTVIENVVGGLGNDMIIGNDIGNVMQGGFGNDTLRGNGGNDILIGGQGNDTYIWGLGDGDDIIDERKLGGRDTLLVEAFSDLGFNDFTDDFFFRRLNRDLVIDFKINGEVTSQGSVRIKDQLWGGSRVETLEFAGNRIDLFDLFNKTTAVNQQFVINFTQPQTAFGHLVSVV